MNEQEKTKFDLRDARYGISKVYEARKQRAKEAKEKEVKKDKRDK